jgi:hypothetical protein
MSRAKASFLLILFLIEGASLSLLIPSSRNRNSLPSTSVYELTFYGYDNRGILAWIARAEEGTLHEGIGKLFTVEATFYAEEQERINVWANSLLFRDKEITLSGNVEVAQPNVYHLQTEELTWTEEVQELVAQNVTLTAEKVTIAAEEFRYDFKSDSSFLYGGVTATLSQSPATTTATSKPTSAQEESNLGTLKTEEARLTPDGLTTWGEVHLSLYPEFFSAQNVP